MKKLITLIMVAVVISCNGPKDPPDDELLEKIRAEKATKDSLNKIAVIKK